MESLRRTKWRLLPGLFAMALGGGLACTKPPPPDPTVVRLQGKIQSEESNLAEVEKKVKDTENETDNGLKDQISEERELVKSRLHRLKELGKSKGIAMPEAAAPAGHH